MQPEKAEFCSDAYLAKAQVILTDLLSKYGPQIDGEQFSAVETFVGPPEHLRQDGASFVRWSVVIAQGRVRIGRDDLQNPTMRVTADYTGALAVARTIYPTDAESLLQRREARAQRMSEGERRDDEAMSPSMRRLMVEAHNRLAAVTL